MIIPATQHIALLKRYADYCLGYWGAAQGGNESGQLLYRARLDELHGICDILNLEVFTVNAFEYSEIIRQGEIAYHVKKQEAGENISSYHADRLKQLRGDDN